MKNGEYQTSSRAWTPAELATELNARGAQGFRHLRRVVYYDHQGGEAVGVRDTDETYTYEFTATDKARVVPASAVQALLQWYGNRGFRWIGTVGDTPHMGYEKVSGGGGNVYNVLARYDRGSAADYIAQANQQGEQGFAHVGMVYAAETLNVYEKQASGRYHYQALPRPTNEAAFMAQLNAQGSNGYRYKSEGGFFEREYVVVYEKDVNQSATFTYHALPMPGSSPALFAQANAEAAKGAVLHGDQEFSPVNQKILYFTAKNCLGYMCGARNGFQLPFQIFPR